jgi:ABC-type nitrate/sulfonate/bicarbonate transport system permease component
MKVAIGLSLVGVLVGEFVSAQYGLGYVIMAAQGAFDTPRCSWPFCCCRSWGRCCFA